MSLSLKKWMEDNAYLFRYAGEMGCMRDNADDILLIGDAAAFLAPLFHQIFPKAGIQASSDDSVIEEVREEYPVISALQIRDKEGKYLTLEECGQEINDYQSLEYYLLFDYEKQ